jgi:hypothetical protein
MVDSFSSAQPYSFQIDSKAYTLPGLSFGDIDEVADALSGGAGAQLIAAKTLLFARSDKRTQEAIKSMGLGDLGAMFRKWAGVEAGEAKASDE